MSRFIAVIGGDARYIELIRQLQELADTTIYLVGFDKLEQGFTGCKQVDFEDLKPDELDVVILPITGTNQTGRVDTVFSDQLVELSKKWFQQLKKDVLLFTGIANDYLTNIVQEEELTLIPLFKRDDIAIYNSIPTAEGTIMMAIQHTDYTIHSSKVMVLGFGRVGNTVANKFAALGADVCVCARKSRDLARATEMGLRSLPLEDLHEHTSRCDLLINTIPAMVVTKKAIQRLPSHALIYDLASKPGGTDFAYAKQRGIKAILAKSLPGVVAPKTSGKILADVMKQFIQEGPSK